MTPRLEEYLRAEGLTHQAPEDIEEATQLCRERGWADGLPIIPPTPERVGRMLEFWDRPWNEPIGPFPPSNGAITPILVAANAVMAGCRPAYFPFPCGCDHRDRGRCRGPHEYQ
jgi:hypothetical protein